jgi:hypothetical protein
MNYDFTIFFTFFADGDIRRKYIEIALNTLFEEKLRDVPIIVIDSSSDEYSKKNNSLFFNFSNLTYINDQEINPFKRCKKYLHLIKTPYVLRLLEDCAYINLGKDNFLFIQNDISLLEKNKEINVIQYPIIDEQKFTVKGNTVHYPSIKFEDKIWHEDDLWPYYDRSKEEKIYHYLCNNILYRTDFFIKHWNYVGSKYTNHNSAEASKPANGLFKFFFGRKYFYTLGQIYYRCYEKLFHPSEIISNIFITKTMVEADVIHIGYFSTEDDLNAGQKSSGRADLISNDYKGVSSTLDILKIFNNHALLNKIKFQRDS